MKPHFALSLSMDGIALLHRAPAGWDVVGELALDSDDLGPELARLREMAQRLHPGPVLCKVVIPNEQIRYMDVATGWADAAERKTLVEAALDGATPYEIEELSYACAITGEVTQVAAVARETLEEAEDFAVSHGFVPLSFVATPEAEEFNGEPFFGLARAAQDHLPPGESVEQDYLRIAVVGRARIPADPPATETAPTEAPAAPETAEPGSSAPREAPVAEALPPRADLLGPAEAAVPSPDDTGTPPAEEPEPDAQPTAAAVPHLPRAERDEDSAPAAGPAPQDHTAAPAGPDPLPETPAPDTAPAPAPDPATAQRPTPAPGPTPRFGSRRAGTPGPVITPPPPLARPAPRITPVAPGDTPSAPAFSSVRARRGSPDGAAPPLAGVTRDQPAGVAAATIDLGDGPPPAPPADPPLTREVPSPDARAAAASLSKPAPPEEDDDSDSTPAEAPAFLGTPAPRPPSPAPRRRTAGGLGALIARLKRPARKEPPVAGPAAAPRPAPVVVPVADREAREAEAARMTVFGARPSQVVAKPRYLGLLLTLILMLFMMGVAAWASIFMSEEVSGLFRPDGRSQLAAAETDLPAEAVAAAPAAEAPPLPDAAEETVDIALVDTVEPLPGRAALPQPQIREPVRQRAPEERPRAVPPVAQAPDPEDEARYAATGVWVSAPWVSPAPIPGTLDDLYVASIDPAVPNLDAVALPVPEADRGDQPPGPLASPAPAGTTYTIGADGRVVPTPEGALTPDGVLVRAGPPARVPPGRPAATLNGLATIDDPAVAAQLAAMQAKRPRLRPGGLVERNERLVLGGYSREELGRFRPRLRPALSEAREQAEADAATEVDTGTAQAVAVSRRPAQRPGDFDARVAAAQAAAIQPVAVVAPRQTVQPNIPSNASVTRTATESNAINLRQINLIGVYGQPSSRRALVRMSDGRYRKVKVGDNLDGGRVSGIGDGQLSYTKSGRNHVLTMPKG